MTFFGKYRIMLLLLFLPVFAYSQYYDWGVDAAATKWRTIRTPEVKYIFPSGYERQATRAMHWLDSMRPHASFGYRMGAMGRVPMVFHTRNFDGNGIVMLAPRRIELIPAPDARQYATPGLKQLVVHEYRHAVQYNNLRQGMIKPFSWLLGQQAEMIGLAFMPVWAMEGDAVMAETMMTSFGRAMQPSFTIEYRALAAEGVRYRTDKYFCGSYRDFIPDHYQLGYRIISWSWGEYGENILDKTSWFTSRNPYMLMPFAIALKKFYGTTTGRMFSRSFDAIETHWRSIPEQEDTAEIIPTPTTSYTTYSSPVEKGSVVVALKEDFDRTARLVSIGEGEEKTLCRVGRVNSPLTVDGGMIYWTEVRQSTLWEQKSGSVLCSYDMAAGRKRIYADKKNVLFPAVSGGALSWVEYRPDGSYSVGGSALPDTVSVHSLAADGGKLYFIGLNDDGMWIGEASDRGVSRITPPTRATMSNLTARDGKLYFGSIASGRDEVHVLDLATMKEYRLTTSRFGSFSPSATAGGDVLVTTYTSKGYLPARQKVDTLIPAESLRNILNPVYAEWDVPNVDKIIAPPTSSRSVKKYRRGANLFNFHSWAPIYFEPDKVMSESRFELRMGVTAMSQNNLNTAYTELGYGYTGRNNLIHGKFKYFGWAPKIELEARWADTKSYYGGASTDGRVEFTAFSYVPLTLSSGANMRRLTPTLQWDYANMLIMRRGGGYTTGLYRLTTGLQYSDTRRMAYRDFAPPLGFNVRVNRTINPADDDFGQLYTLSGRVWLPGVAPHHSVSLRGAVQRQSMRSYAFSMKELFPRGAMYNAISVQHYRAASLDYALPICYPEGGINSLLYIKRIRLNLGGDWARFRHININDRRWHTVTSWGADLTFDLSVLRLPASTNSTATISVYKPSDNKSAWVDFGITLPI